MPPRCWPTEAQPLLGLRFAVKDAFRVQGLKTSLCKKAYLNISSTSDETASVIQSTLDAGARLVGLTKLSSMIGKEEPTEATDYHAPFNPQGDGYQSPAGSSSGSAAALAAYDWLDFTVGTDTTGSARRPALVNGVFQMRPTHDAVSSDGMIPVFPPWDVPALFTRDIAMLKPVISTWIRKDLISPRLFKKPYTIVYPLDFFPVTNHVQMRLIDTFVADLAEALHAEIRKVSIASLWKESPPTGTGTQNVEDYLRDTYINTNFYDYYYHSTNQFRDTYQTRYHKRPYVGSFITWKWELGKSVSLAEREEGMRHLKIYKNWVLDSFLRQESDEALLLMPISNVVIKYRDDPPSPVTRPDGFNPFIVPPILGAPDIVIPIGEYEYKSKISGLKEYLPVAIDVVGLPGTDLGLIEAVQHGMVASGRATKVKTGSRMFENGHE